MQSRTKSEKSSVSRSSARPGRYAGFHRGGRPALGFERGQYLLAPWQVPHRALGGYPLPVRRHDRLVDEHVRLAVGEPADRRERPLVVAEREPAGVHAGQPQGLVRGETDEVNAVIGGGRHGHAAGHRGKVRDGADRERGVDRDDEAVPLPDHAERAQVAGFEQVHRGRRGDHGDVSGAGTQRRDLVGAAAAGPDRELGPAGRPVAYLLGEPAADPVHVRLAPVTAERQGDRPVQARLVSHGRASARARPRSA